MDFRLFSQKPMQVGDMIIIEGQFYNADNNVYINVKRPILPCWQMAK